MKLVSCYLLRYSRWILKKNIAAYVNLIIRMIGNLFYFKGADQHNVALLCNLVYYSEGTGYEHKIIRGIYVVQFFSMLKVL